MTFVRQAGEASYSQGPSSFEFHCEFVLGFLDGQDRSSYSLQNLHFDSVTMPAN
jgi:hypothetical protein